MDKNNDCYFYFYSTCTKDKNCPFRHCDQALGSEVVCELWRIGRCKDLNCPFRHMEPKIKRSTTPCWFETQPQGCRKPHCVFMHTKPRPSISELQSNKSEWILPTGSPSSLSSPSTSTPDPNPTNNNLKQSLTTQNAQINISIDKDEESDDQEINEGTTNHETVIAKPSLEQIKIQKILNLPHEHLIDSTNNKANVKIIDTRQIAKRILKSAALKPASNSQEPPESSEKKENPPKFEVKTLEQIRKEREATERSQQKQSQENQDINEAILKENQQSNSLKRIEPEKPLQQCAKPIKIKRTRLNSTILMESSAKVENIQEATDNLDDSAANHKSNEENNEDIDFEFLNDVSTAASTNSGDQIVIDDDELMRELDQVINS